MTDIRQRTARVNGVELQVTEAGEGPVVVLAHGFPEGAYSWRHQIEPLAAAGYHVIVPEQRGYGSSSRPSRVEDYGIEQLCGDLLGLVDETGQEQAIFVGHDWGSLVVWDLALLYPERVRAVVGVSVPLTRWPMRPTDLFKAAMGGNFFYMLYFQTVGPAEKEMEADTYRTMAKILYGASGDGFPDEPRAPLPAAGTGFLDTMPEPPAVLPAWLTDADIKTYADAFAHSGFFGPVSWYRNLDANYERTKDLGNERIAMPSFFIGGERDGVVVVTRPTIDALPTLLPDFRGTVLLPGVGHWTQQEDPTSFNSALIGFLRSL